MNESYVQKAYQKAVYSELRRYLVDTFIPYTPEDTKAQLVCDDVAYANRAFPVSTIIDVVTLLQEREESFEKELNKYQLRGSGYDEETRDLYEPTLPKSRRPKQDEQGKPTKANPGKKQGKSPKANPGERQSTDGRGEDRKPRSAHASVRSRTR